MRRSRAASAARVGHRAATRGCPLHSWHDFQEHEGCKPSAHWPLCASTRIEAGLRVRAPGPGGGTVEQRTDRSRQSGCPAQGHVGASRIRRVPVLPGQRLPPRSGPTTAPIACYEKVLTMQPGSAQAHKGLGGRPPENRAICERAARGLSRRPYGFRTGAGRCRMSTSAVSDARPGQVTIKLSPRTIERAVALQAGTCRSGRSVWATLSRSWAGSTMRWHVTGVRWQASPTTCCAISFSGTLYSDEVRNAGSRRVLPSRYVRLDPG